MSNHNPVQDNEQKIESLVRELHEVFREEGINKPLDKSKWREYVAAKKLGHEVHKKASAGILSAQYGSDAKDLKSKKMHEYKSKTMNPKQENQFRSGTFNGKVGMVYNGAYKKNAIQRYRQITHNLTLFSEKTGECIAIVEVPVQEVERQLASNLAKKELEISQGKKVTTNCNTVNVQFNNSVPIIGKIVWLDSSMKSKKQERT